MSPKKSTKKDTATVTSKKKKKTGRKKTLFKNSNVELTINSQTQILPQQEITTNTTLKTNTESGNFVMNVKKISPQTEYQIDPQENVTQSTLVFSSKPIQKNDVLSTKNFPSQSFNNFPTPSLEDGGEKKERFAWFPGFKAELFKILKGGLYYTIGIISVVAVIIVVELYSNQRIFPETKAGTIDVSYMSFDNAKTKLTEELHDYFSKPMGFFYKGKTIEATTEELGIRLALDQTLTRLPIFEFEKQNPAQMLTTLLTSREIALDYTIDAEKAVTVLETKFQLQDKRAKNAKISLTKEKKPQIVIEKEQEGNIISQEQLLKDLHYNINHLSSDPIHLILIEEKPRVNSEQIAEVKEKLEEKIKKPLTLTYDNKKVKISILDHIDALTFHEQNKVTLPGTESPMPLILGDTEVTNGNKNIQVSSELLIGLDAQALQPFFQEEILKDIERPTSPANIHRDDAGNVVIEGKGENGKTVPVDKLVAAMELALNNEVDTVPVPVVVEQAPLTISDDLKQMGIHDLLATGHSAFRGSPPNREFNINQGIKKYNGLLIAPGEEFSFNKYLGEVDAVNGYKPEKVIKGDKIEYEYGGGICQVSTTLYRAILQAGLEITERHPHSWLVGYYGQSMGNGLDATIYLGGADLKFLNDTPGYILIQSYTDGPQAYFKLYGTSDGRSAELIGPFGKGLTWRWERMLTKDGQTTKEEIWSQYRPVPTTVVH